jgi:hypothetical protein
MYEDSGPATNDTDAVTSSTRPVTIQCCDGLLAQSPALEVHA